MRNIKEWVKDGVSALFWTLIFASVVIFSAGAFSQFIYTDF